MKLVIKFLIVSILFSPVGYAGDDVPNVSDSIVTDSTVLAIYVPKRKSGSSVIIMPGFGEGFIHYQRISERLVAMGMSVGILIARSHDGIGIKEKDLAESLEAFRRYHATGGSPVLAHSLSAVWALRHLEEDPNAERSMRALILTNPVLQSPLEKTESFTANSERRGKVLRVHVRLGNEDHYRDILVEESAGHMRDLMTAFKKARTHDLATSKVPIVVFRDLRDPVLRGKPNFAITFLAHQRDRGFPVRILEGVFSERMDAHNLMHDPAFITRLIQDGFHRRVRSPIFPVPPRNGPEKARQKAVHQEISCASKLSRVSDRRVLHFPR